MRLRDRFQLLFRRRHLYRQVFGTPEGKVVLADLLKFCNVRNAVVVPGDPIMTGFNDGVRRVGLRIASICGMSDDELIRLSNEPEEAIDGQETGS